MQAPVAALVGVDGLAVEGRNPSPIPWQDPEVTYKPRAIPLTFSKGPDAGLRADAELVYGDLDLAESEVTRRWAAREVHAERLDAAVKAALRTAEAGRPLSD